MYAKKRRITPLLVVLLLLLIIGTTGTTVAKYIHSTQLSSKVTFTAKLAEKITLLEHEAKRNADGSYELTDKTTDENKYSLIPGLDIPKDPYITIIGKTPIKAYLFVEVRHSIGNNSIAYNLCDTWIPVMDGEEPLTGKNGGKVYVYSTDGNTPKVIEEPGDSEYQILENNKIYVSQKLLSGQLTEQHLNFYACLSEVPTNEGAEPDLKTIYEAAAYLSQD